jgi:hypothetical protein
VTNSSVYVEIHLFESEGDARTEFSFQKQWAPDAPIFERFLYGRRMYQEGNVLLFFFSDDGFLHRRLLREVLPLHPRGPRGARL